MILIMSMPLISLYLVRFEIHIVVFTSNLRIFLRVDTEASKEIFQSISSQIQNVVMIGIGR